MWKGKTKEEWEFPPKPRRIRWATYQRLLDQYVDLQNRWTIDMMDRLRIRVDDEIAATGPGGRDRRTHVLTSARQVYRNKRTSRRHRRHGEYVPAGLMRCSKAEIK
jgi:hypothetical protein